MTVKQISVEEFQQHCAEELQQVTAGTTSLQLTDHGKVVAVIDPATEIVTSGSIAGVKDSKPLPQPARDYYLNDSSKPPTLAEWMGSGKGLMSEADIRSFDEPTFSPEDWEEHPANRDAE